MTSSYTSHVPSTLSPTRPLPWDPYDLSTLQVALRSDEIFPFPLPSLPYPSSLRRTFRSERPSYLSSTSPHCQPSPSASPLSSPASPAMTEQRAIHPSTSDIQRLIAPTDDSGNETGRSCRLPSHSTTSAAHHCIDSANSSTASSLCPSPFDSPLSLASTVTSTPCSSISSFSPFSPSASALSPPSDTSSSPAAVHSLASLASLSLHSPSVVGLTVSHNGVSTLMDGGTTHPPLRLRRKRQLAGGGQPVLEQQQPQQTVGTGDTHSPAHSTAATSPLLPYTGPSHRVLPPRPPRVTLRTLRIRSPADPTRQSNEPPTHSCQWDDSGVDDTTASSDVRGKRRRRWPFSPPLPAHCLSYPHSVLSDVDSPTAYCCHNVNASSDTTTDATAVSPLHRLRQLDPIVAGMQAFHWPLPYPTTPYSGLSDAVEHSAAQSSQPLAVSRQRQTVLDRLKALA